MVSINIHELRVLCIWAENWGANLEDEKSEGSDLIYAIAARLRRQIEGSPALTMGDEFTAMKARGINFETNHPAGDQP